MPSSSTLLLDTYTNAAAAYSLRKLRSAYSGAAIRVRRSSDNAEEDIGFSGNALDTSALLAHVGAGDGFAPKMYDQAGGGLDLTQATSNKQSQIVAAGEVLKCNSTAAIHAVVSSSSDVDQYVNAAAVSNFISATAGTVVFAFDHGVITTSHSTIYENQAVFADSSSYIGIFCKNDAGIKKTYAYIWDGGVKSVGVETQDDTPVVVAMRWNGSNLFISKNGGEESAVVCGSVQQVSGSMMIWSPAAATNRSMPNGSRFLEAVFWDTDIGETAVAEASLAIAASWGIS